MERRFLEEGICHYCHKEKKSFTYWPTYSPGHCHLLCDDCSEEMLTAEGHKERTGLISKKSKNLKNCHKGEPS